MLRSKTNQDYSCHFYDIILLLVHVEDRNSVMIVSIFSSTKKRLRGDDNTSIKADRCGERSSASLQSVLPFCLFTFTTPNAGSRFEKQSFNVTWKQSTGQARR